MKLVLVVLAAGLVAPAVLAQEAKPSAESIRQLFEVMHSSKLLDTYMEQIETTMRSSMQQATAGQQLNAEQQKILDGLGSKISAMLKEQLNWASLEPTMNEVYRDTFTQQEVDGMLTFYRSVAGRAVIAKLPTATQKAMQAMQGRVKTLTPKLLQLEKDAALQLQAAKTPQAPASPPPPPKQNRPPPLL
jgi:hypothetical protein